MKIVSFAGLILAGAMLMPAPTLAAPVGGDSEVQISGGAFHAQGSDLDLSTSILLTAIFSIRLGSWEYGKGTIIYLTIRALIPGP